MKKIFLYFCSALLLWACTNTKSTVKSFDSVAPSILEEDYYKALPNNISRLHQLMLGTFVAHHNNQDSSQLKAWQVTGADSVVLYSVPIGEIAKHGYWIFSYEFMTSLPNDPIYTSIKQLKQTDRDSFVVLYYKVPQKYTLLDIVKNADFGKDLVLDSLKTTDKKTIYVRESSVHYIGKSDMYEDKDCHCLRQNEYDISTQFYKVETVFYNLKDGEKLDKKNRPNLMVRRDMGNKLLLEIAEKEYSLEKMNR